MRRLPPPTPEEVAWWTARRASSGRPAPSSAGVSLRMSAVRTVGTQPELRLRSAVFRRGLRYRVGEKPLADLRCSPDLVFRGSRVAVFVDGCFWHGCPYHPSWPKSNAEWWRRKIEHNRTRDVAWTAALTQAGWLVLRIWEHDELEAAADRIEEAVRQRCPGTMPTRTQPDAAEPAGETREPIVSEPSVGERYE